MEESKILVTIELEFNDYTTMKYLKEHFEIVENDECKKFSLLADKVEIENGNIWIFNSDGSFYFFEQGLNGTKNVKVQGAENN